MHLLKRSKSRDKMVHWLRVLQTQILGAQHLYYQKTRSTSSWFLIFETSIFFTLANFLHTWPHSVFSFLDRMRNTNFCRLWLSIYKIRIMCNHFKGVFCVNNALSPLFFCQHMWHKSCTQYQTECGERWFLVFHTLHYYPTTSTAVILQNSCHPSDVFVHFCCCRRSSSVDFSPATNQLCHRNTIAHNTDESPNAFTNISHVFAAVNPTLQQNFIAARSKFFSMVIYNTEHTILQNTLILPHVDGLTSNLVYRWRRV